MKQPIYLDNHSTTRVDPRVLETMLPYLSEEFGNAASRNHAHGLKAHAAVEKARAQVAALISASKSEIIFTSGATESNNLAIKGVAEAYKTKGDHIVTLKTEHKAVLEACKRLEKQRAEFIDSLKRLRIVALGGQEVRSEDLAMLAARHDFERDDIFQRWLNLPMPGARVTYLGVDPSGRVDLQELEAALTGKTILVSIMLANNEIGTLQPVNSIGELCRRKGVLFHCDAVQGLGHVSFDVEKAKVDLVSFSSHKLYGPKGVGALYVRGSPRVRLSAMIDGGDQEKGLRSGTLNVPAIVGFGKAAELAQVEREREATRVLELRERLRKHLFSRLDLLTLNGSLEHRLPGNINVSFAFVEGEALMMSLKEVALSSGSACSTASLEPSYVLRACGVPDDLAHSSIRFGLGRFTTEEEIDSVGNLVVECVQRLRQMSPRYSAFRR
ncbi:IscS subfamily cysteine desulfurase [Stigmatella sp. ncwal1]|uniref:cysteine desulfurase n=1 Tax=Stigmatella ashevillensis TaxID=2995309 RepID=A0ABT5D266_9BACT|nr:IscS subfamily cysteine desulfurase [Stigmatella ashevillena]MDC0707756.1 IscS subfamily cysteine desulfurase [Stigmatella ashevillena]